MKQDYPASSTEPVCSRPVDAMTTDYRAMCAELIDALDSGIPAGRIRMSPLADRARALLASSPDQDDATLKSIREHTPRYRMSVIISTNDSCIDTRMNVIWSALNSDTEILESVSLPEKLSSYKNHELEANEV